MTVYQLLNGYPEGAGLRLIGQSVLETMWGNIVCWRPSTRRTTTSVHPTV